MQWVEYNLKLSFSLSGVRSEWSNFTQRANQAKIFMFTFRIMLFENVDEAENLQKPKC